MIPLNIPQGVITFGSAILAAVILALVTLTISLFRVAVSIYGRLAALENNVKHIVTYADERRISTMDARIEILWELYRAGAPNLTTVGAPENPMKQERWDELTGKLALDELSDDEAEEFLAALLQREKQAREEKDRATLAILGPGIILTKWQLKEKELREKREIRRLQGEWGERRQ